MGLLDALEPDSYDRVYSDAALVRRIARYFRAKTKLVALITCVVVLEAAMGAAFPILLARGVDTLSDTINIGRVALLASTVLLVGVATWGFAFLRQWFGATLVGDVVLELRRDAFDAVLAQDRTFFDQHPAGGIASRVANDTQTFATLVQLALDVIGQALAICFVTLVLFTINPRLALLTLLVALVIVVVTLGFRLLARRASQGLQRALAGLNAHLQESLAGIAVTRNFGQEQSLYNQLVSYNSQWYRASQRISALFSGIFPFMLTLTGFGTVAIVYVGGWDVLAGRLSPGEWYLFLQSVSLFWGPLTTIASFWGQVQQGIAAGERVFALIDAERHVKQNERRPVPRLQGQITFSDVTFRYTNRETVLEHCNLKIEAGETVALVGHTGAGKSSIARLIARSYEFQDGQILIDGQDIRTLDCNAYLQHLGIVPQLPFLFSGTVADNIRYAQPDASLEEIAAAVQQVAGGDWLTMLPQGLNTIVGELGKSLSIGQRQLVALARTLLQNPTILILDEATASIDPLTEAYIQEGLDTVMRERTAIVIAHRLTTVRKVDRIIVLHKGKIVEQGNHATLLQRGGYYGELYNQYFRHQLPTYTTAIEGLRE